MIHYNTQTDAKIKQKQKIIQMNSSTADIRIYVNNTFCARDAPSSFLTKYTYVYVYIINKPQAWLTNSARFNPINLCIIISPLVPE